MSDPSLYLEQLKVFYQTDDGLHLKDYEKNVEFEKYVNKVSGLFVFPLAF